MPKIMLHDAEAREALGRGRRKAYQGRRRHTWPAGHECGDGSPDRHPARVLVTGSASRARSSSNARSRIWALKSFAKSQSKPMKFAGDGTTTATVLANFLVQNGLALLAEGVNPVELVEGLELAVEETIEALKRSARSLDGVKGLRAIASIAANDSKLGEIVAEAFERAGNHGIVAVEFGANG